MLIAGVLKPGGRRNTGLANTPTHRAWVAMRQRCLNKNHPQYKDYGGRGITISATWNDFSVFLNDMGVKPIGMSLERLNNNLGYSKDNCCWASRQTQQRNTRYTKLSITWAILIRQSRIPTNQLAKIIGVSRSLIWLVRKGRVWN